MNRELGLKIVMGIVGALFVAGVYPLVSFLRQEPALSMMMSLYEWTARELITTRCVICHSLDYVPMNGPVMTRARWETSVKKMIEKFGAPVSQEESAQIVDYLSKNYAGSL